MFVCVYLFGCFLLTVCLNIIREKLSRELLPLIKKPNSEQRSAHTSGLVDHFFIPATSPTNSNWFNFVLGLVPQAMLGRFA